jgi:hypothetical protein
MVMCAYLGTNVVMPLHLPDGLGAGLRLEAVEAVRAGRDDDLTDDERLQATYIRRVIDGTVDDELYAAVEQRFGERGAVEYTIFITILHTTIRQMQAFGQPAPTDAEIAETIDDFREGRRAIPDDWHARAVGPWEET